MCLLHAAGAWREKYSGVRAIWEMWLQNHTRLHLCLFCAVSRPLLAFSNDVSNDINLIKSITVFDLLFYSSHYSQYGDLRYAMEVPFSFAFSFGVHLLLLMPVMIPWWSTVIYCWLSAVCDNEQARGVTWRNDVLQSRNLKSEALLGVVFNLL